MDIRSNSTLIIAIWGAAIGTLSFLWNVLRSLHDKPRIAVTIEAVPSDWTEGSFRGIRLELRNRGRVKTTVEGIYFFGRAQFSEFGLSTIRFWLTGDPAWEQNAAASNPKTVALPTILDTNGVWEGYIKLEANEPDNEEEQIQIDRNRHLLKYLPTGKVRYSVQCSHKSRRMRGRVRSTDF